MRPLLVHMEAVETALLRMSSQNAFAFAAACAERAWPVYVRASEGKPWEQRSLFRSCLDSVWNWLTGRGEQPKGLARKCEHGVFQDGQTALADSAAYYVANSLFALVTIVENDQPQHAYQSAQSNLDLLDAFLYERTGLSVSADGDIAVDAHELMVTEMHRQLEDLEFLENPLIQSAISQIRKRSEGRSILGGSWYYDVA